MTADPGRAPVPVAASPVAAQDAVLEIRDLSVVYRTPGGDVRAVDKVNLSLAPGVRYKFNESFQFGTALEFPIVGTRDLQNFRWTLDFIIRY